MRPARRYIIANFRKARQHKSLPRQLYELVAHKLRINTSFRDYYRFHFYRSNESWEEKSLYLGPNGSRYWPFEGNSLKFDRLFALKSLQKSLLMGAGLPTSKMLFKVGRDYPINTLAKFREALNEAESSVVTKFDGGGSGFAVSVLDHDGDGFICDGEPVDAVWLWNKYAQHLERGFIVEEKLENHPVLAEMYPHSLNTVRLNMIKTADGEWHIVRPFLKLGQGGSRVDNMSAGGLFAGLDDDGIIGAAYCRYDDHGHETHPDTGARIAGLRLPYFEEATALARLAARTFSFMTTFGWDVAITADGPLLIEANPAWHFKAIQQRLGPLLTPEIAAGLTPRAWWTPWDKSHMYPDYFRHYAGGPWQRLLAARRRRWRERLRIAAEKRQAPDPDR